MATLVAKAREMGKALSHFDFDGKVELVSLLVPNWRATDGRTVGLHAVALEAFYLNNACPSKNWSPRREIRRGLDYFTTLVIYM